MPGNGIHVLLIGPYPAEPGKIIGGVEAATNALASALVQHDEIAKITVAMFHTGRNQVRPRQINEKLEVRSLPVPFIGGDVVIRSMQCVFALRPLVAELRPDVVHGQGIDRNSEVAVQLGLPSVVTIHGLTHMEARLGAKGLKGQIKVLLFDSMVRRILGRANAVISISEYDTRSLKDMIKGTRFNIPNAIEQVFFEPHSLVPNQPTVLSAGVVRSRKNLVGLVNAFAQVRAHVPNARLVLTGPEREQDYAQQVRMRVAELGLADAVELRGHVTNEQLVEAMRTCTVLAMFSYEETLPTVIAQAMAVGRPVVATRVGGIPEMIAEGETGYMVPAGDEAALTDRLATLLSEPALCQAMGARGQALATQRYDTSAVADQTVHAYRSAIGATAPRAVATRFAQEK